MRRKKGERPSSAEIGRQREKYILENRDRMSYRRMAKEIGISYQTLLNFISRHEMTTHHSKKWTEEEEEFLIENIGRMTKQEIGDHLGRSYASVCAKYNALPQVQERRKRMAETRREEQKAKRMSQECTAPEGKEKER